MNVFFLLPCGGITIGENIPKIGIPESKTMHITMLTVHLKIGLEYALDQFESESGEGPWRESSSRGYEGEGRPVGKGF